MSNLFIGLLILSFFGLIVGFVKPSLVKLESRKMALTVFGGLSVLFFVLFGITSDSTPTPEVQTPVATKQETSPTPKQQTPVVKQNTPVKTAPTQPAVIAKSYQQVFVFSGNGTKKSEPFTISGGRFKISYDCQGDPAMTYCGAYLYKVGSNLPQVVMNSTDPIKDETIIYTSMAGKGDYYIDANTTGSFTMTVYDYR